MELIKLVIFDHLSLLREVEFNQIALVDIVRWMEDLLLTTEKKIYGGHVFRSHVCAI